VKCPFCGKENQKVVCTIKEDGAILRIRLCMGCLFAWRTTERYEENETKYCET
jgi:transcriptional regulator NrdR family protein